MGSASPIRIEVTSHCSDLGHWRAAGHFADPRLRDYVIGYFASEGFLPKPLRERHLPSREVAIMLNFAGPHRIIEPSDPSRTLEHRTAWVVALQHQHQFREAFGARDFTVIRLTPIGAQSLLGTPMDLLTDRIVALEDLDRQFARLLVERAADARDWVARFEIIENIIGARLAAAPAPPAGLQYVWRMLQESPHRVDLARISHDLGCSRRHSIAQFRKYFGMAPKMVARISRFHLALAQIHRLGRKNPSQYAEGEPYLDCLTPNNRQPSRTALRWTDLALDCGYYDQSHFINEFRSFSGMSPLDFLQITRSE